MLLDADRDRLRKQLVQDEDCILHAYPDSLGYWTIGVGRLIDARKGGGISALEAYELLDHDIDKVLVALVGRFPFILNLTPPRQAVLANMGFNLGIVGLAGFTRTLMAVQNGAYDAAAQGMLKSLWAKQVGPRAERLAQQMRTGVWP